MEEKGTLDEELVLIIDGLGKYDSKSGKFTRGTDLQQCLRDLLIALKKDNDTNNFQYRCQIASANVLQTVLIPLTAELQDDRVEFDAIMRLLNLLTSPVLLNFDQKLPDNKEVNQVHLKLNMILYQYKILLGTSKKFWTAVANYLGKIVALADDDEPLLRDITLLERIMLLIRNVLHIPLAPSLEKNTNDEANPQDKLIEVFLASGIIQHLQAMYKNEYFSQNFCLYLVETMSLLFRQQSPEFLAKSYKSMTEAGMNLDNIKKTDFERDQDSQEFDALLQKEKAAAKPVYRPRFKEATYQLKNMKGLGEEDILLHKTPQSLENITLPNKKASKKKAKHLAPLTDDKFDESDGVTFHKSTRTVRFALGKFCDEFLSSYNSFMRDIRYKLSRSGQSQANDQTYYLWAFQFFMEFNRYSRKDISCVSETLSVEAFHYIHTLIQDYLDHLKLEKVQNKQFILWSRRMHYGIKAYKELLYNIHLASQSKKFGDYDLARSIKGQVFYENDYRDMLFILLRDFDEKKMSPGMLRDLIETNHIFLNMLQKFCLTNDIVVATKAKKAKKPKGTGRRKKKDKINDETWDDMNSDLLEALEGRVELPTHEENEEVIPMDSTIDFETELQKRALMKRLRRLLLAKQPVAALALYRNAREAWSDDGEMTFGKPDITPEEEAAALKEIYFADFNCEEDTGAEQENNENQQPADGIVEEEVEKETVSVMFDFKEFVQGRFCTPKIIMAYFTLLNRYDRNTQLTNNCIAKMFHRIAWDFNLPGLFYQACIFRVFQRLLAEKNETYSELRRFAQFIVSKFVQALSTNEKLLPELLFWKRAKEAKQLEFGFKEEEVIDPNKDDYVHPQYDSEEDRLDDDELAENVQAAKEALFGDEEEGSKEADQVTEKDKEQQDKNANDDDDEQILVKKRRSKTLLNSDDEDEDELPQLNDESDNVADLGRVIAGDIASSELDLNIPIINGDLGINLPSESDAPIAPVAAKETEEEVNFRQEMRDLEADLFGDDESDNEPSARKDKSPIAESDEDVGGDAASKDQLNSSPIANHRKPRRQIIESDNEEE